MASEFPQKYSISADYLPAGSKRRSGLPMRPTVKFIVAHDTGNPGSTAAGNVSYYKRSCNDESASAHIFVDDRSIIECIPALTAAPEKAWHVLYKLETDNHLYGYNANDAAVGVEYCFGPNIDADEAYRRYVWVMANICARFDLDPATAIVGHFFLDPARKSDPVTGLARSRRTYEQLLRDVVTEFKQGTAGGDTHGAPAPVSQTGQLTANTTLNVRKGAPNRLAPLADVVRAGQTLNYVGWTEQGEAVNGNPKWYLTAEGNYFWSGAVRTLG
ncbi:peptidoglycan recognition family protein [Uliginosibacterium sediminicola]|uniref:N-acetylmuramoyl-L-alanine amidase n=1 Tax=Uliginosibacterium sediminicola TaxID=2024550 RepID=A0ABU9YU19_9RHOO